MANTPKHNTEDNTNTPPQHFLDKRTVQRRLNRGLVSREVFENYLGNLPDASENADNIAGTVYGEHKGH